MRTPRRGSSRRSTPAGALEELGYAGHHRRDPRFVHTDVTVEVPADRIIAEIAQQAAQRGGGHIPGHEAGEHQHTVPIAWAAWRGAAICASPARRNWRHPLERAHVFLFARPHRCLSAVSPACPAFAGAKGESNTTRIRGNGEPKARSRLPPRSPMPTGSCSRRASRSHQRPHRWHRGRTRAWPPSFAKRARRWKSRLP